jgi:hypothetical protein
MSLLINGPKRSPTNFCQNSTYFFNGKIAHKNVLLKIFFNIQRKQPNLVTLVFCRLFKSLSASKIGVVIHAPVCPAPFTSSGLMAEISSHASFSADFAQTRKKEWMESWSAFFVVNTIETVCFQFLVFWFNFSTSTYLF